MANGRGSRTRSSGRDSGGFIALPWVVSDSAAFLGLTAPATKLLLEIARQYVGENNGWLLCTMSYMKKRGWKSNDVLHRAKNELLDAGLIFQTVQGCRPNKASRFAITWQQFDRHKGHDSGVEGAFVRSAYANNNTFKNAPPKPRSGIADHLIAPSHGIERFPLAPPKGAITPPLSKFPTPSDGDHLEMPSVFRMNAEA